MVSKLNETFFRSSSGPSGNGVFSPSTAGGRGNLGTVQETRPGLVEIGQNKPSGRHRRRKKKKSRRCVSLFMRLIQNVFFNFGGAGKDRKERGEL